MIKRRACSTNSAIFVEEDLDEIGRFQAERLIEEMIKLVGPFAYNQAIEMLESL